MASRVTNIQLTNNFVRDIFTQRSELEVVRQQVASGQKVRDPSDDPGRAGTIAEFQFSLQRIERHEQRVALAESMLSIQDSVLSSTEDILLRAKELATQAANETNSPETRATIAQEVWNLRDNLISLGNTKVQGIFIYGGAVDDQVPFQTQTGVAGYANPSNPNDPANKMTFFNPNDGTQQTRSVNISDIDSIRLNTPGDRVFENGIIALERLGRALSGYDTELADSDGDGRMEPTGAGDQLVFPADYGRQSQLLRTLIDDIENARGVDVNNERADLGSRMNKVNENKKILDSLKINIEQSRAILQDVDIFEAASNLTNLQVNLEALLASGSRIQSLSLLDFI